MRSSNNVQAITQIFNNQSQVVQNYQRIGFDYQLDLDKKYAKETTLIKKDTASHFYHCLFRRNNFDRHLDDYIEIIRTFEKFLGSIFEKSELFEKASYITPFSIKPDRTRCKIDYIRKHIQSISNVSCNQGTGI